MTAAYGNGPLRWVGGGSQGMPLAGLKRWLAQIDHAVAPTQMMIEPRAARLLHDVRELPPGPERNSFVEETEQIIAKLEASKARKPTKDPRRLR